MTERLRSANDIVTLQVELAAADKITTTLKLPDKGKLENQSVFEDDVAEFGLAVTGRSMAASGKTAQVGLLSASRAPVARQRRTLRS
ncbi:hypothetical protein [Tahibacter aquaticus]|uniref:hypothetical protein n=1 Tax=Tahibacter aquaticus TaxID=520092 RepID=UPI00105FDFD2|nr:hypothetical protein [Tahibacter aquaticus]